MDVTVNIRGNAQGLRDELDNVSNSPDQPVRDLGREMDFTRPPVLPPSDILLEEIRQEIQSQRTMGSSNPPSYRSLLDDVTASQREAANREITNRYDERRSDLQSRLQTEYEKIDKDLDQRRSEGLNNLGPRANDPLYRSILDQQINTERERRYREVGSRFDPEFEELDKQESQERESVERELTDALKALTEEAKRMDKESATGSDPNSYINQLREERRRLVNARDNSPTEAGAMESQRSIQQIDDQLKRIFSSGNGNQGSGGGMRVGDTLLQGTIGIQNFLSGASSGNLGSMVLGAGGMFAGLGGMGLQAAARFMPWVGIAAAAAQGYQHISENYDNLGQLAAFRSTAGGYGGERDMGFLAQNIGSASINGLRPGDLRMNMDDFYSEAVRRIRARGTTDDWYKETLSGVALERNLALDNGALARGAQYDRYGENVTDAISKLVTVLSAIEGSGVSLGDFSRVQEKFDIQQQIMASYMNRTDNPNYNWANNTLAAFSATGVQQDARLGTDIASFQDAIQNPMNDRMKALIYGTVSDLFPETEGRMDLIDRELRDPANEGKILQAVIQRVEQMYGGTNTTMGYFVFKSLFPNIAPDRLDKEIQAITSGQAGNLLKNGRRVVNQDEIDYKGNLNKETWIGQAAELSSSLTKGLTDIKNILTTTGVKIIYGNGASPNSIPGKR